MANDDLQNEIELLRKQLEEMKREREAPQAAATPRPLPWKQSWKPWKNSTKKKKANGQLKFVHHRKTPQTGGFLVFDIQIVR